jgi:putative flippase GtrA
VAEVDRRFLRFALVGASNGAVTVATYSLLLAIGVAYPLAAVAGYLAGIANGYTWNRIWTFETGPFHLPEFVRYLAVQGFGLALNLALLYALVEGVESPKGLAEIVSIVPVVLITFLLNRRWTFHPTTRSGPT